ncbi:MAG: SH3 domain-containing protein [Bacteroidales bacterium]|nr:SH3 domain-containing protein [Bacteroidales bacterium]
MIKINFLFPVIILLLFSTSCSFFKRSSDTTLIYTVKSNTLNVRESPNAYSKILGKVTKGDTIKPVNYILIEWIPFTYNGKTAFVNANYLTGHRIPNLERVSNMQLGNTATIIRDFLNKYVNWRTGIFWAITLGAVFVIWILMAIGRFIDGLVYWDGAEYEYGKLPYFMAFVGALFSVVYLYSREDVLQALFVTKLWWFPEAGGWIPWYLWSVSVVGLIGLLFFWFQYFSSYGFWGIVRVIYYTCVAIVGFVAGIFWGIIGVIFGIVYLFLSLSEGFGSSGGGGFSYTSGPTRRLSDSEQFSKDFWDRKYDEEWRGKA